MRSFICTFCIALISLTFTQRANAQVLPKHSKFAGIPSSFSRLKAGFGYPYGFFGINAEWGIQYGSFNGGIGFFPVTGGSTGVFGWSIGLRGYFMNDYRRRLRIRLGTDYGVHGAYLENEEVHTATGLGFSVGMEHKLGRLFLYDMDIHVPIRGTNSFRPERKELELLAFPSLGIGLIFGGPPGGVKQN